MRIAEDMEPVEGATPRSASADPTLARSTGFGRTSLRAPREVTVLRTTHVRALTRRRPPRAARPARPRSAGEPVRPPPRRSHRPAGARSMGGRVWGYFEGAELVSACHAGCQHRARRRPRPTPSRPSPSRCSRDGVRPASIVGPRGRRAAAVGAARADLGSGPLGASLQPFLVLDERPGRAVRPPGAPGGSRRVRRALPGLRRDVHRRGRRRPRGRWASGYRARVAQLISQGWAFAIVEDGEVLFKTEVGAATSYACQLQGVWVRPDRRGRGHRGGALAAVVRAGARDVSRRSSRCTSTTTTRSARRTYERVGFRETATFASILL